MSESLRNRPDDSRRFYLDVLRVVSIVCVIIAHAAAQSWYRTDVHTFSWQVMNFYDSVLRWSVLEFAMISGILFLGRDIPLQILLRKYVLRILIAFLFWSTAHALMYHFYGVGWKQTIKSILQGPSNFWYLYMIAGMYLLQPLVKKIAESSRLSTYYCVLSLIFAFAIPQALSVFALFHQSAADFGRLIYGKLQLYFLMGFPFYFLLGYWLDKTQFTKNQMILIWSLGVMGFVSTVVFTALASMKKNVPMDLFHGNFTLNVMAESVLVFVLIKRKFEHASVGARTKAVFAKLSAWSFGAFLCHVIIQVLLNRVLHFNTASLPAVFSVPLLGLTVSVLAFAVSAILHRIPGLRKYIL